MEPHVNQNKNYGIPHASKASIVSSHNNVLGQRVRRGEGGNFGSRSGLLFEVWSYHC